MTNSLLYLSMIWELKGEMNDNEKMIQHETDLVAVFSVLPVYSIQ